MGKGEELFMCAFRACLRAYIMHPNRQEAMRELILSLIAIRQFRRIMELES